MDIIVDTREQLPLFTGPNVIRFGLSVGDYTTVALRKHFVIERKSLQDLYGTITKGHVRFRNELIRANALGIKLVVVVEGTRKQFVSKDFPGGKARQTSGETLGKIMDTVEQRYKTKVVWCRDREHAKKVITAYLRSGEKKLQQYGKIT